jgi:hypothetical protein
LNEKPKRRGKHIENYQKQKNNVACNPDSGRAVVLSVPRSAFLAYVQPAGASRRPNRGDAKIQKNTGIKTNGCVLPEIGFLGMPAYICYRALDRSR